jgi:type I restriction enzyme S subunit
MSFPRYERYRNSGAEWLGDVPEHWSVERLGRFFQHIREKVSDKDFPALSVTKNGIVPQLETAAKTDDGDNRRLVRAGDFVINGRSDRNGSAGLSTLDGSVSLINLVLRPIEVCGRYVHFLLRSLPFQQEFYRMGKGIVADLWSTGYEEMSAIVLAMPPSHEQAAIAAFLDRETAKIDGLVEEQRRLIELIKEKRRAAISHAVTKGLDPNAQMKDSEVFWIGEVPKHWSVSALRYFVRLSSGSTPDRSNEAYWDGGIPWVKTGEINYALIANTEETISAEGMAASSVTLAPAGAMLLALYGQGVTRGRVALLGIPATFNQACVAIEPDSRIDKRYLFAFFVFAYQFIREIGNETTQMNLNVDFVKGIRILIPPLHEQRMIAEVVEAQMAGSDALVDESIKTIDLLLERRSVLISAAATGKIDVRGLVKENAA